MNLPQLKRCNPAGAFTLAEMAVSMGIGAVVVAGMLSLFISFLRSYNSTTLMRISASRSSSVLERMVYGVGTNAGLREAVSGSISNTYTSGGWKLSFTNSSGSFYFQYTTNNTKIVDQAGKVLCTNVIYSTVTNYTGGCRLWIKVCESAGGRKYTNSMTTFVEFRN